MLGVFAIIDTKAEVPGWMRPVLVGALVLAIGVAFGFNAGYAINPARDLGPRMFTAVAGWGSGVFSAGTDGGGCHSSARSSARWWGARSMTCASPGCGRWSRA